MDYLQQKIVVIGAGLSGQALVRFFCGKGAEVTLSDRRGQADLPDFENLADCKLSFDLGGHSIELFRQADLIAVSPGVPLNIEPLIEAAKAGVKILGEVEIAVRELKAPMIAITGTNGKSTTTSLIGEMLKGWGKNCFVGGNLGTPLVSACGKGYDSLVVELSSFQLEALETFSPNFALMLNLSEDHLDRYSDFNSYLAAKEAIFSNMGAGQYAILNENDARVRELIVPVAIKKIWFSAIRLLDEGMGRRENQLVWRWQGNEVRFDLEQLKIKGEHNIENAMAAMIAPLVMGMPAELAWQRVCAFTGLPHRMQQVSRFKGLTWINDSKGTNVGSVVKSLAGLTAPVTLIAGGKDKGGDYAPLREPLSQKVACLVLLGEATGRMDAALADCCPTRHAADMAEAVRVAAEETTSGGTVLLSPACSSFDMYTSYAARGDDFVCRIKDLEERE
ncbi:UDP-N-acetylmuramoyl-L-alanine--D-glutamate ligase [Geopsychrobacter electrodiphilus]|uniref:UDP-N-acetylmuramoyl-L-alanine--D-glutamate ligase n=1 Tax=Geopsychrobacter electrodiphilus TaxID=225196 RepID=UPI00037EC489|nr:UDP-N-acetylmuramoyl-L-alanine--D-glutamate ligase [Geopsychrobacter electrodiphilus]